MPHIPITRLGRPTAVVEGLGEVRRQHRLVLDRGLLLETREPIVNQNVGVV